MSRLDRLFTLLSTSTSASARTLAAQQLGEVQKTYPDELHSLLTRLHPLLRSKRWETRIAASAALASILKEVPQFQSVGLKEEKDVENPILNVQDILKETFIEENEENAALTTSVEEQKKRLNAEMGLDVAAKLGICQDLVNNEDLDLSAREKNVRKRQKRKEAKEKDESCKRLKLAALVYSVTEAEKEALSTVMWPLEIFTQFLRRDLKSANWEERHGAATALREIISSHGGCQGQTPNDHLNWLHQLAYEFLSILAHDRFGDFVSDQVVAPVRETTAMALGNLMKLMEKDQLESVIKVLLELSQQSDWECRHGAFLGRTIFVYVRARICLFTPNNPALLFFQASSIYFVL